MIAKRVGMWYHKRTMKRTTALKIIALLLALLLGLSACGDPHKGMVEVNDGTGQVWITPEAGVPVSTFSQKDFSVDEDGRPVYKGDAFTVMKGVDVSFYQGEIDWDAAAADGIQFAFIRCGYRGYTEGVLKPDEQFEANIAGALKAGLKVGVYFFSQAVTPAEAAEEAAYALKLIAPYQVTLPVVFDWERIDGQETARTNNLDSATLTDCAVAFCQAVKAAGYTPGVYFYRNTGYYGFDLTKLTDYVFWLGTPGGYPDFYYAHTIWQYSFEGAVDGIAGSADLDLLFTPVQKS